MAGVVNFQTASGVEGFQELKVFRSQGKVKKIRKDRGGGTELHEIRLVR